MRSTTVTTAGLVLTAALALASCGSEDQQADPTPSGSPSASASTSTSPYPSSEVSFVVDGTTTYGTLETPSSHTGQPVPAALLLPGSGLTDRNGNETRAGVTPDTLRIVADLLAKQGVASLRFDKYFTGRTGAGEFAADPSSFTIDDDVTQAEQAYAFLSRQSGLDPTRLLVVGHSEGGLFALLIASSAVTRPAGLALLEPQDERSLDLIQTQLDEGVDQLVSSGDLESSASEQAKTDIATAVSTFRAGGSVDTDGMDPSVARMIVPLLVANRQPAYLRTWDEIDPVAVAAGVAPATRVLVTEGTRDTNVPPDTIAPLISALASASTTGPGLRLVDDSDHFMHLSDQPLDQPLMAPAIVAAITGWAASFTH